MGSPNLTSPPPLAEALAVVGARSSLVPRLGLVLGSGFGAAASAVQDATILPYAELPGFADSTVPGHAGRLILGHLAGVPVAVLAGRAHFYEGHDPGVVTFPIRLLHALGVESLLLTNAAGGIRADLAPGDFVALTDHLNFMGMNPLRGAPPESRFVDLSEVYDPGLRSLLRRAGDETGQVVKEGVYLAVAGPSYETPAEIRAFGAWGADLVGMSTVPEAIVARHCGLRVAGLSCVTNRAAGLGGRICHQEVLDMGRRVSDRATRLLTRFAREMSSPEAGPALPS